MSFFPKIKSHNLKSMLEKSVNLYSIYSYYRRNMCTKNEQSRWKIVEVRNFTHCPPLRTLKSFKRLGRKVNVENASRKGRDCVWNVATLHGKGRCEGVTRPSPIGGQGLTMIDHAERLPFTWVTACTTQLGCRETCNCWRPPFFPHILHAEMIALLFPSKWNIQHTVSTQSVIPVHNGVVVKIKCQGASFVRWYTKIRCC